MNCPNCGYDPAVAGKQAAKQRRIEAVELVDNTPFRKWYEAREAEGISKLANKVCRYMNVYGFKGYMRHKTGGEGRVSFTSDSTYLRRQLGIAKRTNDRGLKDVLPYDEAVVMARAMNLDPVDVGV